MGADETVGSFPQGPDRRGWREPAAAPPAPRRGAGRHARADRGSVLSDGLARRHGQRPRPGARPGGAGDGHGASSRGPRARPQRPTGRRRAGRDLAVRCAGPLRPSAPARPRAARFGLPGLRPSAGEGRRQLQLPHAEARRLSRPRAAHPLQGRDGIGRPADQPVLHRRRARQRARRRLPRRHPRSRASASASRCDCRRRRASRRARSPPRWTSSSARGGRLSGPLDGLASAGYLILKEDEPWRAGNRQRPQTRAAWRSGAI